MARAAAADAPAVLDQTLGPELPRVPSSLPSAAPDPDAPTLWTRWARSLPALPLEACDVEVESDLRFVRLSLSGRF